MCPMHVYTQRDLSSCPHVSANFNTFGLYLQSLLSTRTPYEEFHRLFKSVPMDQFPINGTNYIQILYQYYAYNSY